MLNSNSRSPMTERLRRPQRPLHRSYAAGAIPLIFVDGAAEIDGTAISIKSFSIEGDNGLIVDRRFIGNTKEEPLRGGELAITGTLEYEFEGRRGTPR